MKTSVLRIWSFCGATAFVFNRMRKRAWPIAAALFLSFLFPQPTQALDKPFDHSVWDAFLKKFVNDDGQVDYAGVQKDPKLLNEYLAQLAAIDLGDFTYNWPREEKLAVWMNAYHAGIISIIARHYPVKSIQDIPGVWNAASTPVAMKNHTLNDIRASNLISVYRDEKIHTALACGAKSCPKLRNEAYTGPKVEGQLFLATRDFVNDSGRNKITPGERKVVVSRIFKWYARDFELDFGTLEKMNDFSEEEMAVLSFIAHYLDDSQKIEYLEDGHYKIKYSPFDWSLNDWRRGQTSAEG